MSLTCNMQFPAFFFFFVFDEALMVKRGFLGARRIFDVCNEGRGLAADTKAAAFSWNSSAWANVPQHLLRRQPATANKFQMGDWYNRSNDMKMLWDSLSHFTGVVSVALRHMFTSAISGNQIPQGNLDWMCTYMGLKLLFKMGTNHSSSLRCQLLLTLMVFISVLQCFPWEFPPPPPTAGGSGCRWREKMCVLLLLWWWCCLMSAADTSFPAFQIIYNSGAGDRRSCKGTRVLQLINKLNQKFGASVFTWKWIINWPELLCVTDGDVTHCGCAQPAGLLNSIFALCDKFVFIFGFFLL